MLKQLLKTALAVSCLALTALPASAQPQVRVDVPLPGLDIRIGHRAPPRFQREVRTDRPSRDHIWVPGSWDWQRDDWAWVPGRWDRPSERRARWVQARYRREGNAWRYEPAHWSNQRIVEGDDYRRWRSEHGRDGRRGDHGDRDNDRDHDGGRK